MSIRFTCDRCGKTIPSRSLRLKLVVDELDLRCDLCGHCSDSLRAWVRNEPADPMRSLTA